MSRCGSTRRSIARSDPLHAPTFSTGRGGPINWLMARAGRWSRLLARTRAALKPAPDHYEILDTRLAQRMGGLLWIVGGLVVLASLPFAPPDHAVGDTGWIAAGGLVLGSLGFGVCLLRGA